MSATEKTSPLDLVKGLFSEEEYKPKRRATTASSRNNSVSSPSSFVGWGVNAGGKVDEGFVRGQRIFSTSVTTTKRTLAQCVILENFHLAKMEVQAILLEVSSRCTRWKRLIM